MADKIVNFAFSIHAMTSQQLTYLVQNLYHDVAYEQACATRHGQRTPMIMQITFRHFMLFFLHLTQRLFHQNYWKPILYTKRRWTRCHHVIVLLLFLFLLLSCCICKTNHQPLITVFGSHAWTVLWTDYCV